MSCGLALASASSRAMLATAIGDGVGFGFDRENIEPRESGLLEDAVECKRRGGLCLEIEEKIGFRRCPAEVDKE
jgi:hypothetical protein